MVLLAGVDEAGRGPVIGPLVLAGVLIEEDQEQKLKELGVKDSKLLSEEQRNTLFKTVKSAVKAYKIIVVEPKEIDEALLSQTNNLNKLEAIKYAKIIDELNPQKAILDCPSTNPEKFKEEFKQIIKNKDTAVIAEHKADLNYPVVGAASILAKVTRDRAIEKIKQELGINIGSGYPSDPTTQAFLKEHYKTHENIIRKTWSSYKNIIEEKRQKKLGDF